MGVLKTLDTFGEAALSAIERHPTITVIAGTVLAGVLFHTSLEPEPELPQIVQPEPPIAAPQIKANVDKHFTKDLRMHPFFISEINQADANITLPQDLQELHLQNSEE